MPEFLVELVGEGMENPAVSRRVLPHPDPTQSPASEVEEEEPLIEEEEEEVLTAASAEDKSRRPQEGPRACPLG